MAFLADYIKIQERFARSANLERDSDCIEPLSGYVVTSRALEVIKRIADVANSSNSGGAWALTGPYGSGKSSLAVLIDAAFGPEGAARSRALKQIDQASKVVGDSIRNAHEFHRTEDSGFFRGVVSGSREPVAQTISRALRTAVNRRACSHRISKTLIQTIVDATEYDLKSNGKSTAKIVETARRLASESPLLLIVDEFGKNIEAIEDDTQADPYLLQQIAEAGQAAGLPIFFLTLQHLSFENYMTESDHFARIEWEKVRGRFEDIAFFESSKETRYIISTVFQVDDERLKLRIDRWADSQTKLFRSLGIADLLDPKTIASCYPLHPFSTLLLPELCSRYGQHERTLFSFLTSPHAASATSFLAKTSLPNRGRLPSLQLDAVYDYFVSTESQGATTTTRLQRLQEIALRIRDLHGFTPEEMKLVKTVAMLNLISIGGTVRASSQLLSLVGGPFCEYSFSP